MPIATPQQQRASRLCWLMRRHCARGLMMAMQVVFCIQFLKTSNGEAKTTGEHFVVVDASLWSSLIYDRALRCQFLKDANSDAPTTTGGRDVVVHAPPLCSLVYDRDAGSLVCTVPQDS